MRFLSCRRVCVAAAAAFLLDLFGATLPALAQDAPVPPNTLPCEAFAKKGEGAWMAKRPVTFDVGNAKNLTLDPGEITPKTHNLGGIDLYVLLEAKCGKVPA